MISISSAGKSIIAPCPVVQNDISSARIKASQASMVFICEHDVFVGFLVYCMLRNEYCLEQMDHFHLSTSAHHDWSVLYPQHDEQCRSCHHWQMHSLLQLLGPKHPKQFQMDHSEWNCKIHGPSVPCADWTVVHCDQHFLHCYNDPHMYNSNVDFSSLSTMPWKVQ